MTIERLKEIINIGVDEASKMTDLSTGRKKTEWRLILGERVWFKTVLNTVVYKPVKHGRWEYTDYGGVGNWHCSVCHNIVVGAKGASLQTPYCPNCGAKMNEVEE